MAASVTDTMTALQTCVCEALEDADRPVCGCGFTVGPPMIGPAQCCTCATGTGQVVVFLERMYPSDGVAPYDQVPRLENCRPGPVAADFTIVLSRCYPTLDKTGNGPSLDATTAAADDLNADMSVVWKALQCCGSNIVIRESAVDADPEGGCSAFAVRVTTLVKP